MWQPATCRSAWTAPGAEVAPVRLERIRFRTLLTMVASVAAAYLLAGELARASLSSVLHETNWNWGIVALALSASTYIGATISLSGFVAGRLSFFRTLLVQVAGSFVTLVTPAAVGGAALNIRYLQRWQIPAAAAAASVGFSQVVAFVLHLLLLVVLAVVAIPAGRRLLRARLAPVLGQVLPRLLAVTQQPRKLAEGIGGALLLTAAYILCLDAC